MKTLKKLLLIFVAVFFIDDTARSEIAKGVPAVAGATTYYLTLNEWVAIATLAYIALQAAFLIWKWWREANRSHP